MNADSALGWGVVVAGRGFSDYLAENRHFMDAGRAGAASGGADGGVRFYVSRELPESAGRLNRG